MSERHEKVVERVIGTEELLNDHSVMSRVVEEESSKRGEAEQSMEWELGSRPNSPHGHMLSSMTR